ncbi:MAG TPA: PolC-type DNA polymerase III, partial [Acholeplasmataceae bacterium]|nr:PolC-type DNA polymerase III [Acholeplasmataceae bacterium]
GPVALKNGIKELLAKNYLTVNEQSTLTTLQVAYEMSLRGFHFKKVDINHSDAKTFVMEDDALRMPFISIDGLGENVANGIVETRTSRVFSSKEDVKLRTKINQTVFAKMESYGAFDELIVENDEKEQGLFAL